MNASELRSFGVSNIALHTVIPIKICWIFVKEPHKFANKTDPEITNIVEIEKELIFHMISKMWVENISKMFTVQDKIFQSATDFGVSTK